MQLVERRSPGPGVEWNVQCPERKSVVDQRSLLQQRRDEERVVVDGEHGGTELHKFRCERIHRLPRFMALSIRVHVDTTRVNLVERGAYDSHVVLPKSVGRVTELGQ